MLLRRQDAFEGVWQTQLDFEPSAARESAGTAVWWSKWAFASVERESYGSPGIKFSLTRLLPQCVASEMMSLKGKSCSNIPCWRTMMFTYVLGFTYASQSTANCCISPSRKPSLMPRRSRVPFDSQSRQHVFRTTYTTDLPTPSNRHLPKTYSQK